MGKILEMICVFAILAGIIKMTVTFFVMGNVPLTFLGLFFIYLYGRDVVNKLNYKGG